MVFIKILMSFFLITITRSQPLSYNTYDERELSRERAPFLLLINHRIPDLENEMFDSSNDPGSTLVRTKRIGSLSIVNNLDVLRQRVLLELARRKAMQDQQQVNANRRLLDVIGKRSLPLFTEGMNKPISRTRNGIEFTIDQEEKNQDRSTAPEKLPGRLDDWLQVNDGTFRERHDDQTRRVQSNELRLL
ncbi:corticotropin-releasing diuretic hormone 44 [Megalopta genalis]|uniref:corticotropin-releasing diuretic hormone 44 n=1 Tax=Megalopta genalis TaxID=115081 RepID=UPI0014435552|nr:diuretic hormone 44 [Megalopta genalis]